MRFLRTGRDPVVLGDLVVDAEEDRLFLGGDVGTADSASGLAFPSLPLKEWEETNLSLTTY